MRRNFNAVALLGIGRQLCPNQAAAVVSINQFDIIWPHHRYIRGRRRIKMPHSFQAVAGQPGVDAVLHSAIVIHIIAARRDAKAIEVEVGIAALHGVKSPGHDAIPLL